MITQRQFTDTLYNYGTTMSVDLVPLGENHYTGKLQVPVRSKLRWVVVAYKAGTWSVDGKYGKYNADTFDQAIALYLAATPQN